MKQLLILLGLSVSLSAFGQARIYNASSYGAWSSQVYTGNTSTGASSLVASPVVVTTSNGQQFIPFLANEVVTLDKGLATAETVTVVPTNCFAGSLNCTLSATFSFKHTIGSGITSGTFGLQEAINQASLSPDSGTVLIDNTWQGPAGSALITAAVGFTSVVIQDNRSGTPQFYQWNGSQYVLQTVSTYVLEQYLNPADGHGGQDYGYATVNFCAQVGCSTLTAPVALKTTRAGVCQVYTSMVISAPIVWDGSSCAFVPQSTMASTPVSLTSCSTTIGSNAVTCTSTAGLSTGMAVGGDPTVGPENYVASITNSTTFQLILPASRNFLGIPTVGSPTIKGIDSQIDAANGQTITGTGIPASTTISSINPATNTWTMSANSTVGTLSPVDLALAPGTVVSGLSLTAVAQTPVILVPPSNTATSQARPHGPNYGVNILHTSIRDPQYSHSSFGRSLTGVVGIQVFGQDGLYIHDVTVEGIRGAALVYGGFVPASTADGSNAVHESEVDDFFAYSDGDISSGQACLAIMTGLGNGDTNQDEDNQLGFHNFHCVYPDAEDLWLAGIYTQAPPMDLGY